MTTLTDLTDPARDRLDDARRLAETAGGQLRDRSGQLIERAEGLRERVPELRDDLDPAVRRVQLGFWEAIRVLASSLMILPRLLVRLLSTVAQVGEYLTGQRAQVAQLAREAAQRVPEPRGAAFRRRLRAGAWLGFAFGVGLGIGWLLGRREADDELHYDAVVVPPPVVEPAPVPATPEPAAAPRADGDDAADADDA